MNVWETMDDDKMLVSWDLNCKVWVDEKETAWKDLKKGWKYCILYDMLYDFYPDGYHTYDRPGDKTERNPIVVRYESDFKFMIYGEETEFYYFSREAVESIFDTILDSDTTVGSDVFSQDFLFGDYARFLIDGKVFDWHINLDMSVQESGFGFKDFPSHEKDMIAIKLLKGEKVKGEFSYTGMDGEKKYVNYSMDADFTYNGKDIDVSKLTKKMKNKFCERIHYAK